MKKNIAIVTGGDSSELEVSLKSCERLKQAVDSNLYDVTVLYLKGQNWHVLGDPTMSVDKSNFSLHYLGSSQTFDLVLLSIHGAPAENGQLQGYFETIGQLYLGCNQLCSALSFNKYACNNFLRGGKVHIAPSKVLYKDENYELAELLKGLDLPLFVKPNEAGSSFGISRVNRSEELMPAIEKAFAEDDSVLLEAYIEGLELTNGAYELGGELHTLPVTEVIPKNEFFDFEAKYNPELAEEITPARISDSLTQQVQETTKWVYKTLKCEGIVRVDYILKEDTLYFLEVNTIPGMTATSFIPQQFQAAGTSFDKTINALIQEKLSRYAKRAVCQ